jgi:SAM-dependent methyltransferase
MEDVAAQYFLTSKSKLLLDYGCGNMPYRPIFEPRVGRYIGCDLWGNEFSDATLSDSGMLPFDDQSSGTVLSNQVLEHVVDPCSYIAESYRVLEPGGVLILSTHGVWRYHPDPTDFWRWTSDGLRKIVDDAGFEIERFKGILGPEATALQLLQDAVLHRIPRSLSNLYTWRMQSRIRRADLRCSDKVRNSDGCVYVVVARKKA